MTPRKHRQTLRRRRESRTDYQSRKKLLLSGVPAIVTRKTSNYIYVSIVSPSSRGDLTLASANSKELKKSIGLAGLTNIPAAYLTGMLAGKRATEKGIKRAVVMLGPAWSSNASIPYASAQGCSEAGLEVPVGGRAEVDEERLMGQHIAEYATRLKERGEEHLEEKFAEYLRSGVDPMSLPDQIEKAASKILEGEL